MHESIAQFPRTKLSSALRFLSIDELGELEPPDWLIKGFQVSDSLVMTYGSSGCGKTFHVLDKALHIASGRPYHGREVKRGDVIYIPGEGQYGIRKRIAAWKKHHGAENSELARFAVTTSPVPMLDSTAVTELLHLLELESANPRLIVIDTLNRNFGCGGDENSSRDMSRFVDALDRIRLATGACIEVVHHTGKDESGLARGSSVLRAAIDSEIAIKSAEDGIKVTCTKQKDAEPFAPISFKFTKVDLGQIEGTTIESLVPVIDNVPKVASNGRKLGACQIAGLELLRLNFLEKNHDPTHVGPVVVAKRWLLAALQDAGRTPDGKAHGQSSAYDFPKFAISEGYAREVDKYQIELIEGAWLY